MAANVKLRKGFHMRLKDIEWKIDPDNSAIQIGWISGEMVACIKQVGEFFECIAGTDMFQGGDHQTKIRDERVAKEYCRGMMEKSILKFCDGEFEEEEARAGK